MAQPLALTIGEPAGIGPDIAIQAWLRRNELKLPAFYLLGDRDFLGKRATALGLKISFADVQAEDAFAAFADALPVVATGHAASAEPGLPDDTSADAATASIRQAVGDVLDGQAFLFAEPSQQSSELTSANCRTSLSHYGRFPSRESQW